MLLFIRMDRPSTGKRRYVHQRICIHIWKIGVYKKKQRFDLIFQVFRVYLKFMQWLQKFFLEMKGSMSQTG